jgi:hypothetical protein
MILKWFLRMLKEIVVCFTKQFVRRVSKAANSLDTFPSWPGFITAVYECACYIATKRKAREVTLYIFSATGNTQSRIIHRRTLGPEYKQVHFIQNFLLVWKEDAWTEIIFTNWVLYILYMIAHCIRTYYNLLLRVRFTLTLNNVTYS